MRAIWLFTVAFIWAFQLDAAPKRDFISSGWQLPDGAAMVHFNGQESLFIPRGVALLGTEQLQEGILEVDISDDNARGFAGLVFHHNGQGTYEEVYLRLHKFGQPDALQYAPVFHNSASWVLYPEHQAVVQFQPSAWTHLKVVFQGNTARVYVNHATSPALLVPQLKVKDEPGAQIGLKALDGAYFTNFTFTPLAPSTPEATVTETAPPRTIMQWQLSNSFAVQGELAVPLALPQENKLTWQLVSTEASGLLNVSAYRPKGTTAGFPNKSEDLVWLKASIPAEKQQYQQLFLEFSNKAQVFLNGQPLLYADNSFRAKGATYRGDIDKKLNSNALFLPLKKGQNTLLIALSSTSEGWGIMARLVDALPSP